jgi:hypothetical protein
MVQHNLKGCNRWGEGWGILYFEALVVQWKDIRRCRHEFGPEGKHFVLEYFLILGGAAKLRWAGGGGAPEPTSV